MPHSLAFDLGYTAQTCLSLYLLPYEKGGRRSQSRNVKSKSWLFMQGKLECAVDGMTSQMPMLVTNRMMNRWTYSPTSYHEGRSCNKFG